MRAHTQPHANATRTVKETQKRAAQPQDCHKIPLLLASGRVCGLLLRRHVVAEKGWGLGFGVWGLGFGVWGFGFQDMFTFGDER